MISKSALEQSIRETGESIRVRQAELNAVKSQLVEMQRELRLLVELAEIRGLPVAELIETTPDPPAQDDQAGHRNESEGRSSSAKADLLKAVIEILAERGSPMQIRELMAKVQERGVTIPGSGQQANLIAYISRDERIVRPRRGFYALHGQGLGDNGSAPGSNRRRTGAEL